MAMSKDGVGQVKGRQFMRSMTTFDPSAKNESLGRLIPRPAIPLFPILSLAEFIPRRAGPVLAVVDSGRTVFTTSGCAAIALAFGLSGIRSGEKVLIPAFHCRAMVEPLSHVSAMPVFVGVRENLSIDLEDAASKLDDKVRALLVPNYFGFPQDWDTIRAFCGAHGLILIEDCAHSFYGSHKNRPLGSFGDFAVASLTKFFPVREGGCLVVNDRGEEGAVIKLQSQDIFANARALLDTAQDATDYGRLPILKPVVAAAKAVKAALHTTSHLAGQTASMDAEKQRSVAQGAFDRSRVGVRATGVTTSIVQWSSRSRVVEGRRRNYFALLAGFDNSSNCRPLLPELPDGVVPFMFPLWIDNLSAIFGSLEDRGVPMQRFGQFLWPGVDAKVCSTSVQLSRHLIQLPCHQSLTKREIDTIIREVRSIAGSK